MSVVIKGFTMPKGCSTCGFNDEDFCRAMMRYICLPEGGRDSRCPLEESESVETNIYDIEETYPNCTVQIWKNSVTGECSIGWWRNDN